MRRESEPREDRRAASLYCMRAADGGSGRKGSLSVAGLEHSCDDIFVVLQDRRGGGVRHPRIPLGVAILLVGPGRSRRVGRVGLGAGGCGCGWSSDPPSRASRTPLPLGWLAGRMSRFSHGLVSLGRGCQR